MSAILFSPAFSPQKGHQTIAILETTHFPFSSTGSNFTFNSPGIFTCPAVSSSLVLLFDAASCPCLRAILYYTCYTYYTMLYYGVLWLEWRKVGQLLAMLEKRCDQVLASLRIVGAGSLRPWRSKYLSIGNTLYFTPETRMFMRLIKNIYARKNYDEMEHSEDEPEEEY